jgi:chalcone isomerase-like protein
MKCAPAVASLIMALSATEAHGKQCEGIFFPNHAQVHGALLTLNGLGLRTASVFRVGVYVAALYLTEPSSDPHRILQSNTPSELVLRFIRRVGAHEIRKSWEQGFARNFPGHPPALEEGLAQLNGWVTDVRPGQRMTFIRIPGTGMQVDINGTVKGMIAGDEFSKAFLSIWFGDFPQTPELKRGLLGGPCE